MDDMMPFEFPSEGITVTKTEPEKLSDLEMELICYYEQRYWESGNLPTIEKTAEELRLTTSQVTKIWNKEVFKNTLIARGLRWDSKGNGILTPKQLILANLLLEVDSNVSLREKLKVIGVSLNQYHTWLRDPAFTQYLRLRVEQQFNVSDVEIFQSLISAAKSEDVPAIKLYMEMRGHYNPRVQVDINIETVIYRVAEIVHKYVKDPEVVEAIATELSDLKPKALTQDTGTSLASFSI